MKRSLALVLSAVPSSLSSLTGSAISPSSTTTTTTATSNVNNNIMTVQPLSSATTRPYENDVQTQHNSSIIADNNDPNIDVVLTSSPISSLSPVSSSPPRKRFRPSPPSPNCSPRSRQSPPQQEEKDEQVSSIPTDNTWNDKNGGMMKQLKEEEEDVKRSSYSNILQNLPLELFDTILSFLDQSFIIDSFSLVNTLFYSIARNDMIWKKRIFTIRKRDRSVRLDLIAEASHVQISHPKFHKFESLYYSRITNLDLCNNVLSISQLAFLLLTNSSLSNISLSNLQVTMDGDFKSICKQFGNLDKCVSLRWIHVHLSTVQMSNSILKSMLEKCPNLETLQFATQNCANLDTANIIFKQPLLRNLSLFGVDEISLSEFMDLYSTRQWNSINLQNCRRLCNGYLLFQICNSPYSANLRELTLKFEPTSTFVPQLNNNFNELNSEFATTTETALGAPIAMNNLQVLRLHNTEPRSVPLVTNIVHQCAKSLQILSLHVVSDYDEISRTKDSLKRAFQFFPGRQYPNLKQLSTSNLPFRVCTQFQLPSANLEKLTIFGIGEKMDSYFRMSKPFIWDRLRVLFLENVSFSRTKSLTSLIFSIPNLEVLKFSYVLCESNHAASGKMVYSPPDIPKIKLTDLEVQDSTLTAEFYHTIFSASPNLKHLKLSNMESDHVVASSQRGYGKFFEHLSYSCRNLLTLNLEMRACPCLKDLTKAYILPRVQQVSILDLVKLRFDEALTFILSITNAQQVHLFIDPSQMMEGSFYFFKDVRSFYEHLLTDNNETVDYFHTHGNFGDFVFQIIKDRIELVLPYVKVHYESQEQKQQKLDALRRIFNNYETLKQVPCCWQFYLFCGMSLALINPTLKMCCERDLHIHMDQFNWSLER